MRELRYTLLSEGSSDVALIPHLSWLLRQNDVRIPIQAVWADLRRLRDVPKDLLERVEKTLELYPCDLLFVHRDADREPHSTRKDQLLKELQVVKENSPFVCVVPVRMQEAWLLLDSEAIRRAAGNPHGSETIPVPRLQSIEDEPDPKTLLHSLLRKASGLSGRRLKKFNSRHGALRVSDYIEDFSLLRSLSAFNALESDIKQIIAERKWSGT